MKNLLLLFVLTFGASKMFAQVNNLQQKFDLPATLSESSGAIFFNDRLVTHNDSGNQNQLYELDTISGTISRTITISNASNIDWEDIAQDDTSIYIGDIGNNSGNRTDLKIYKINKNDYLSATNVTAEVIRYNYSDQTDFTPNFNNTEWDAEALISFDDQSLIVFTKDWINGTTRAYPIPKNTGSFSVDPLPTNLSNAGLITGATLNPSTQKLYLVGYSSILQPFVWLCEDFTTNDVLSGTNTRIGLSALGFEQAEAITHIAENNYFITSESFSASLFSDNAKLISFTTSDPVLMTENVDAQEFHLYPNPVKNILHVNGDSIRSIEIHNTLGSLVYKGTENEIQLNDLQKGIYFVTVLFRNGKSRVQKILKS